MDLRPLVRLLADGGFHSGHQLASELGFTRALVCQQIEILRQMGIEVHAVTGKGYRLPTLFDLMSRDAILELLGELRSFWSVRFDLLFATESTNTDAMRRAQEGQEYYLVLAEHQSMGRGRRGKTWLSPLGGNIALTLAWTFASPAVALEGLSLAVATFVVEGLRSVGYGANIGLKWPNDILLNAAKLAGILIEISGDVKGPSKVLIGIGINVKIPSTSGPLIDQAYTDLASNFEINASRDQIVAAIVASLTIGLRRFSIEGFAPFLDAWNALDVYRDKQVDIVAGASRCSGVARGVNKMGALILQTAEGSRLIAGGELSPSLRLAREAMGDDC